MLGIPEWAFGVVVILLVSSGLVLLVRWLQPEIARPDLQAGATDSTERSQTWSMFSYGFANSTS